MGGAVATRLSRRRAGAHRQRRFRSTPARRVRRTHGRHLPGTKGCSCSRRGGLGAATDVDRASGTNLGSAGRWDLGSERRPPSLTLSRIMAWVALDRTGRDAERFKLQAPLERWRRVRDHMHATICELGFDSNRNTFTQSFGSSELDASLLLMPLVGFLPPD